MARAAVVLDPIFKRVRTFCKVGSPDGDRNGMCHSGDYAMACRTIRN